MFLCLCGLVWTAAPALADPVTNDPYVRVADNFENPPYALDTPLVDGTNGWYASSTNVIVQDGEASGGSQAAMIPVDCFLSNRFQSKNPTNVWLQMDVMPSLYDGTNNPVVETNASALFFINSNGNFVVHDGAPSPDETNSVNWVTTTAGAIATNAPVWVTVKIRMDYASQTWDLYADNTLVTNNISFVNSTLTNFTGFDLYNGGGTSYLDNVVMDPQPLLAIATAPTGGPSGQAFVQQPILEIRNAAGDLVDDDVTVAHVALVSGAGTLSGTTNATAVNGVVTFANLAITGTTNTDYGLQFTCTPALTTTGATVQVTHGAATQLTVAQQPVGGASGGVLSTQPIINIRDAQGNVVTGDSATVVGATVSSDGVLGGGTAAAASDGVATFAGLTLGGRTGENYVVTFTSFPTLTTITSAYVTVTHGVATHLAVHTQPSSVSTAGVAFAQQPVVRIYDAFTNLVTTGAGATLNVTAALSAGDGTLAGTLTKAGVAGVADFAGLGLNIDKIGLDKELTFSAAGVTDAITAPAFTVVHAAANHLAVHTQPSASTVAGAAFDQQPIVRIYDAFTNLVTTGAGATLNVTAALSAGDGTLFGTTTKAGVAGVADFAGLGLNIDKIGADKELTFSAAGVTDAITAPAFAITHAAAHHLVVHAQPSASTVAGVAFAAQPVVRIYDAYTNLVTTGAGATLNVTAALTAGDGALAGTTTKAGVAGVADFAGLGLNIDKIGADKVLTFSAAGVTDALTDPAFAITHAAAARLGFAQQPTSTQPNIVIAPPVTVQIQDAFSNLVSSSAANVTVAISNDPSSGAATLAGTLTRAAASGVATFDDLSIDFAISGYTLSAESAGLGTVESAVFNIGAPQSISNFLPADGSVFFATETVGLSADATSGLAVQFAVFDGPGAIAGLTNLSFTGTGVVRVVASQPGDLSWNPAPEVTNTYTAIRLEAAFDGVAQSTDGAGLVQIGADLHNTLGRTVDVGVAYGYQSAGQGAATNYTWLSSAQAGYGDAQLVNSAAFQALGVATSNDYENTLALVWATQNAGNAPTLAGIDTNVWLGLCVRDASVGKTSVTAWVAARVDNKQPVPALTSTALDPTAMNPIPVQVEFDEDVDGFTFAGVLISNGTGADWQPVSARVYRFNVVPTIEQGVITVQVQAGAAQDAFGNQCLAGELTRDYDAVRPLPTVTSSTADPTGVYPIPVEVAFNKDVTGFSVAGVQVVNGTPSRFEVVSARVYRFDVMPVAQGLVTVNILEGAAQDALGNLSLAGVLTRDYEVQNGTDFEASGGLRRVVRLTWGAGEGVDSYEIWRALSGEALVKIAETTSTNYFDRDVETSVLYDYALRGVNPIGEGIIGERQEGWCRAAVDDFTGDGVSDLWYYHQPQGVWYILRAPGDTVRVPFGWNAAMAVPADYDGDGKADPAIFFADSGYWAGMLSGRGYATVEAFGFGGAGAEAVPGDYDGDGLVDPAVYYQAGGFWRVWMSARGYAEMAVTGMGGAGWLPVPGDYDGDGITDPCAYDTVSGRWRMWLSDSQYTLREISDWSLGGADVIPVAGDYLGIGHDVPGLYYRDSGMWYFRKSDGSTRLDEFGPESNSRPMLGDYDGDGITDLGLLSRESYATIWRMLMSQDGYREVSGHEGRPRP